MSSDWLSFVSHCRECNPEMKYKEILKLASKEKKEGSGLYQDFANKIRAKGTEPLGDEELHLPDFSSINALSIAKNKGIKFSNFAGPGTNLKKRLERGDEGINATDDCSRFHDIDYTAAEKITEEQANDLGMSKEEAAQKIRRLADEDFKDCLKKALLKDPLNAILARQGFIAKNNIEDTFLLPDKVKQRLLGQVRSKKFKPNEKAALRKVLNANKINVSHLLK